MFNLVVTMKFLQDNKVFQKMRILKMLSKKNPVIDKEQENLKNNKFKVVSIKNPSRNRSRTTRTKPRADTATNEFQDRRDLKNKNRGKEKSR